jgi:hypothetical protein
MPGLLPSGLAGGAGQRVALGLALQFFQVGPSQGLHSGVLHHRGLLRGAELTVIPRMPLRPGGADRAIAQDLGR